MKKKKEKKTYEYCNLYEKYNGFAGFRNKHSKEFPNILELYDNKNMYCGVMFYELSFAHEHMKLNAQMKKVEQEKLELLSTLFVDDNKDSLLKCNAKLNRMNEYMNEIKTAREMYANYQVNPETFSQTVYANRAIMSMLIETDEDAVDYAVNNSPISKDSFPFETKNYELVSDIISYLPLDKYNRFINDVEVHMQEQMTDGLSM